MILQVKCHHCSQKAIVRESVTDRVEMIKKTGMTFPLTCNNCSKMDIYNVNEVNAKEGRMMTAIASGIFIIGTPLIGYLLRDYLFLSNNPYNTLSIAGLLLVPSMIYVLLSRQEREKARRFNKHEV